MTAGTFDELKRFKMAGFQKQRPFSSFLPGIAGPMGVPLWAFYANRGQAITSFGVEDKDHPILEFQPANKAYQGVSSLGFRTFLQLRQAGQERFYEPFSTWDDAPATRRDMWIGMNELELEEEAPAQGLQSNVLYFTLPGRGFPALVRQVRLRNTGPEPLELELL